jgi:hypothetical protein
VRRGKPLRTGTGKDKKQLLLPDQRLPGNNGLRRPSYQDLMELMRYASRGLKVIETRGALRPCRESKQPGRWDGQTGYCSQCCLQLSIAE